MKTISGNIRGFAWIVAFLQFKKREKHSWRSVTFNANACNFSESNTAPRVFLFLPNCAKYHMFFLRKTDFFNNEFYHSATVYPQCVCT